MRVLRFMVVAASLGLIAPGFACAQDKPDEPKPGGQEQGEKGRGGRGGRGRGQGEKGDMPSLAKRLKEPLSLTDEQVTKIARIEEEAREEAKKARENKPEGGARPDREEMRKKFKEHRDKIHDKIKGVLTDEQKKKFEDLLKKQDEEHKKYREGGEKKKRPQQT